MAAMSQMQMRYIQEEDRFLLRMNTIAEEEYRFWLTRCFIKNFYPLLKNTLYTAPEIKSQPDPINKETILSFQQENAKKQVEYNTTFSSSAKTYPLGENPLLICKASIKFHPDNTYQLHLSSSANKGLSFTLDQNLLHILTKLILDSLPQADWQLVFNNSIKEASEVNLLQRSNLLN